MNLPVVDAHQVVAEEVFRVAQELAGEGYQERLLIRRVDQRLRFLAGEVLMLDSDAWREFRGQGFWLPGVEGRQVLLDGAVRLVSWNGEFEQSILGDQNQMVIRLCWRLQPAVAGLSAELRLRGKQVCDHDDRLAFSYLGQVVTAAAKIGEGK